MAVWESRTEPCSALQRRFIGGTEMKHDRCCSHYNMRASGLFPGINQFTADASLSEDRVMQVVIDERSPLLVSAYCAQLPYRALYPFEIREIKAMGTHAYFWTGHCILVPATPLLSNGEAETCLKRWAERFTRR
jgi:hypothetical protein